MRAMHNLAESTREITVLAEDPTVLGRDRAPLRTKVRIPAERLLPGPRGARIEVIDYDVSSGNFYAAANLEKDPDPLSADLTTKDILDNPALHAVHVYGVAAATLFEFERALGRSLAWGFSGEGHQLKIAPHAFNDANAYYVRAHEALLFGYYDHPEKPKQRVFTCLSHDIVAHEVSHALLDGLRDQLVRPSSPEQEAFHEGFADIIAYLSVLRSEELIQFALTSEGLAKGPGTRVNVKNIIEKIKEGSILAGLAKEFGTTTEALSRNALRRSVQDIEPNTTWRGAIEKEHDLGEIIVAIVMRAFFKVWAARLDGKVKSSSGGKAINKEVEAWRVIEEGAKAAQHLLTLAIRSIDYMPCVHITFDDVLLAMITADWQTCRDDSSYGYRKCLRESFAEFGIRFDKVPNTGEPATYSLFEGELHYGRGNIDSLHWDRDSMFRFIWDNLKALELAPEAYTKVNSVRSVHRVGPHGQILRETVCEFYQLIKQADAGTLRKLKIKVPKGLPKDARFDLVGGGTLIFDEFGSLKFYIANHLNSSKQADRVNALRLKGQLTLEQAPDKPFALMHLKRQGYAPASQPPGGYF
jgi:hypothetical protein